MMNIRQRSVNVNRLELLEKLKENLKIHQAEYAEAVLEYRARLEEDLKLALKRVKNTEDGEIEKKLKDFRFTITFPPNHEKDYIEVIEMLEMSVDDTINLDAESFRAYIKNEWVWKAHFEMAKMAYAAVGSSLS